MLTITRIIDGKRIDLELHGTPIGNTVAKNLPAADLYAEMVKLKIQDILPNMGWMDLAIKLAEWDYRRRENAFGDVTSQLKSHVAPITVMQFPEQTK